MAARFFPSLRIVKKKISTKKNFCPDKKTKNIIEIFFQKNNYPNPKSIQLDLSCKKKKA